MEIGKITIAKYNNIRGLLCLALPVMVVSALFLAAVAFGEHVLSFYDLSSLPMIRKLKALLVILAFSLYYYMFFRDGFRAATSGSRDAISFSDRAIAVFGEIKIPISDIEKITSGYGEWGPYLKIYYKTNNIKLIKTAFLKGGVSELLKVLPNYFPGVTITQE